MRRCRAVGGKSSRGFTLVELAIVVCIVFVLAAVLFPVFVSRPHEGSYQSCMSNEKQIGLALIQYVQDYDETFPQGAVSRSLVSSAQCPADFPKAALASPIVLWNEALYPYERTAKLYKCPGASRSRDGEVSFSYMYSDLAAGKPFKDFASPAHTVVVMDGDVRIENIGHAWTPDIESQPAVFGRGGHVIPGFGATVRNSATRHSRHANYLFSDGHVKSLKPQEVFFQPRLNMSGSHLDAHKNPIGPDPEFMTSEGHSYKATFQLR